MKITSVKSLSIIKRCWPLRLAAFILVPWMLLSCGGGKGDATTSGGSSMMSVGNSISAISSLSASSSISDARTSTSSSQSPIEYSAEFSNVSITRTDNEKLRINFIIQSETISESVSLSCRWNADTSRSVMDVMTFPCNARVAVIKEFDIASEGSYMGELSVILPDKNIVKLNQHYEVIKSPKDNLIDVSNQFTAFINENFYVFQNSLEPRVLRYLPKQLALSGLPGVASVQRTNKVSNLLKVFLELSDSDWISANQITFSSKFTLDVDLQRLRQESEAAGYTGLMDLKVKPPLMMLEHRYVTSVPAARIQIQCKNLTLLIDGNEVTLQDCNLADTDGIIATQTMNNIGSFRYESLNFDPETISENRSLRGTFNIDYTLPGTREFDRVLSANSGDLQHTWQLYFNWPLKQTMVNSTVVSVNWKTVLADFNTQVSAGQVRWDENSINKFFSSALNSGSIVLAKNIELTPALHSTMINYLKQELFIAVYSGSGSSPLMWAPTLRFKNVDQPNIQQITFRYFDSELLILSRMDLSCLTKPDAQNNIYKSSVCASNSIP